MCSIDGFLSPRRLFLANEYDDLQQLHSLHPLAEEELLLPDELRSYFLCELLHFVIGADEKPRRSESNTPPLRAQVAALDD